MEEMNLPEKTDSDRIIKIFYYLGVVISCLVILLHKNIPFPDYPNHLARYYLLTRDYNTPLYHQFYVDNFRIIPNIGVDALMAGIGRIMEPSLGLRLLVCGMLASSGLGFAKLSMLRNGGKLNPSMVLFPVLTFSFSLILGFLNFVLAASILPWAIYLYEGARYVKYRALVITAFSIIFFFCHLLIAVLWIFIVAIKLALEEKNKDRLTGIVTVALTLLAMIVLYKFSSVSEEHSTIAFSTLYAKFKYFFGFIAYGPWWPITSGSALLGFLLLGLQRYFVLSKEDKYILIGLFLFYMVCPFGFRITANMDARVPPIILMLLLAMALPNPSPTKLGTTGLASILLGISLINLTSVFVIVNKGDREANRMREILKVIPAGDSLFIADVSQWNMRHRENWFPSYKMLAYFTAIDRPLFISGIFTYPSQQPVIMKPGLETLAYASPDVREHTPVAVQVNSILSQIAPRRKLLKSIDMKSTWVFFVNYERSGYDEIQMPEVVYRDKNYLLVHFEN